MGFLQLPYYKARAARAFRRLSGYWIAACLGILLLAGLGLYHQPYYPQTWLDEGFVLQGAMNLAQTGEYGMRSVEGMRVLDQPLIANGPGVVVPIAAVFALFGVKLLHARLLMVAFLMLTAVLYFIVAKKLYGKKAALTSLFLLLAVPLEGFVMYGRHALGNVPALAYFLLGYWLWLAALEHSSQRKALAAGLLFGLAAITKGQYLLMIPAWLVVLGLDYFYFKQIGVKRILVMLGGFCAIVVAWYITQIWLIGWANVIDHLLRIQNSSAVTITAFALNRVPGSVWYLFRSGFILFVIPGLFYVAWLCWHRKQETPRQLFLLVFVTGWAFWYVFISVGWARYAFEAYAVGLLFTGKAVADSLTHIRRRKIALQQGIAGKVGLILFFGAILMGSALGLGYQIKAVVAEPNRSPQDFADYLQKNTPRGAIIESWEWELDALIPLTFHHPTNDWVDMMTAVLQLHDPLQAMYDPFVYNPDYLIDGPFSKLTSFYQPYLADCCTLMKRIGPYDLYQVHSPPP